VALPSDTPVPMLKEYIKNIDNYAPLVNSTEYRSCLGLLQQQLPVRPDISFPISKLATRSNSANERDMEALRHLIKYLWRTRNRGLFLRGNDLVDREFRVKLLAYADAAGPSGNDSRAQYAVTFNLVQVRDGDSDEHELEESLKTGKICTKSSIAPTTELAMTESEIGALKECTKDVIFLRCLMEDLHQKQWKATPIYNDNQPAIILGTKMTKDRKKVRYCLKNINWCLEQVKANIVEYTYMQSCRLPPDGATKLHFGKEQIDKTDILLGKKR